MTNSWISKSLIIFLVATGLHAHQEEEVDTSKLSQQLTAAIKGLRAFQPGEVLEMMPDSSLPAGFKNLLTGWAWHQQGNYKQAEIYFNKVDRNELQGDTYFANRLDELHKSATALKNFSVYETDNFTFRYQDGPDKVLLSYLPDIMEEVYARYSDIFHYARDEKIIVELMPDHRLFSYASALTRQQIETTGTIALCVENRLVMLTPRRVLQGYYWPDVIAHEFVHYILTKQSRDNVPLWMQEGVAKYFEARWEYDDVNPLDAGLETALAQGVKSGKLITVEEMKPSFAALPTAALARQAYAQVTSMIDYLSKTRGEESVHRIVVDLKTQPDMDKVMMSHYGKDFAGFETDWQAWLPAQNYRDHGDVREMGVTLLDADRSTEKIADAKSQGDDKKHIRLGDLLLERNRYDAALRQYVKIPQQGAMDRQLILRMVMCYTNLNRHREIIQMIDEQVPDIKHDATMLTYKARAYIGMDDLTQARNLLDRVIRINPFNPEIFLQLMVIEQERGNQKEIERVKAAIEALATPTATITDSKS